MSYRHSDIEGDIQSCAHASIWRQALRPCFACNDQMARLIWEPMNINVANVTDSHDGIDVADPVLRHTKQMANAAVAKYNRLACLLVRSYRLISKGFWQSLPTYRCCAFSCFSTSSVAQSAQGIVTASHKAFTLKVVCVCTTKGYNARMLKPTDQTRRLL